MASRFASATSKEIIEINFFWSIFSHCFSIQLFQLTLSDQSIKLEDKTARLCGNFFLNKFMKTSHASPVQWRFMMASHLDEWNSRILSKWGSSCFEDGKSGVRPYCRTRKHQWGLFRSRVNWLVNLSSDEGDTNENITWKYRIISFVLLLFWHYFNSFTFYGNGELPSNQIGRSYAEIKKTEWKLKFMFSTKPWIWSFHFDLLQRMATKCNKIQNTCAKQLFLHITPFVLWRFHCCRSCHCSAP